MLPRSEDEARRLLNTSCGIGLLVSIAIFVALFVINAFITPVEMHIYYLLCLSLLMGSITQPGIVWLNRQQAYFKMGNIRMIQADATLGFSILFCERFELFNGLILGFLGGQLAALACIIVFVPILRSGWASRTLIGEYFQFIKFGSVSSMISTLSRNLPAFMIKTFFNDAALGWYTVATKYLNAPIEIFSNSIGQVYFKEASTANSNELRQLTNSIIRNIFLIIAIPVLCILFFGPVIFEVLLGEEWRMAGRVASMLILWYFVAYASGPLSVLIDVKLKLKWELNYNILLLVFRLAALLSAYLVDDVMIVLGIFAAVGLVFNTVLLTYVVKLSRQDA